MLGIITTAFLYIHFQNQGQIVEIFHEHINNNNNSTD